MYVFVSYLVVDVDWHVCARGEREGLPGAPAGLHTAVCCACRPLLHQQ